MSNKRIVKSGDKLRVRTRLTEAASGQTVWSDSYDFPSGDSIAIQKQTAERIYGVLAGTNGRLIKIEEEASWRKPESDLTEYDYYLRSMTYIMKLTYDNALRARKIAEELTVNRLTVAAAFKELESQGWIEILPQKGAVVKVNLPVLSPRKLKQDAASQEKAQPQRQREVLGRARLVGVDEDQVERSGPLGGQLRQGVEGRPHPDLGHLVDTAWQDFPHLFSDDPVVDEYLIDAGRA